MEHRTHVFPSPNPPPTPALPRGWAWGGEEEGTPDEETPGDSFSRVTDLKEKNFRENADGEEEGEGEGGEKADYFWP
eukprot:CAMPEP_0184502266 /NCGR_PEP_ID=MMETSP0113_2-20130426/49832_1 /TAXON_ID=91329 /ORGANISM="Norrisiella sphaerica, Strain BC52" /LENGTH=76 /DNA_ID=CAMNT_0026891351 /DNA_START=386 /DNA_END=613 /DNA_ORIENTATION=+